MNTEPARLYRLWPRYRPAALELGAGGTKLLLITGSLLALIATVLSLPPVVRATGLSRTQVFTLFGLYYLCMVMNDHVLHPWAMRSERGFRAQIVITPAYNALFLALFVVLPGDPKTPMWLGLLLYTCVTAGWQEIDASVWLLLLHTLTPLLTIPFFLAAGADPVDPVDPAWSIAGPAICSVLCLVAYHLGATTSYAWRTTRAEQAAAIERLRERNAELERERIAQDLHDSVGSSLSIFGLSADLVEQHVQKPEMLMNIASSLRAASKEGLTELRGMLDTLSPHATTSDALMQTLVLAASRISDSSGRVVTVHAERTDERADGTRSTVNVSGPSRLAVMRIFQEAVNNAIRHANAQRIDVQLSVGRDTLSMRVINDGSAFVAPDKTSTDGSGRGLPGMHARAAELGGSLTACSLTDGRTQIALTLPLMPHG
jgi:signal transduction histidine kinase